MKVTVASFNKPLTVALATVATATLAPVASACAPELKSVSEGFAAEWPWLCGDLAGEVTTHWPALQQLAEQGGDPPLAERLLGQPARRPAGPHRIADPDVMTC